MFVLPIVFSIAFTTLFAFVYCRVSKSMTKRSLFRRFVPTLLTTIPLFLLLFSLSDKSLSTKTRLSYFFQFQVSYSKYCASSSLSTFRCYSCSDFPISRFTPLPARRHLQYAMLSTVADHQEVSAPHAQIEHKGDHPTKSSGEHNSY